ncbi:hypothetical protein POSPLADRAFT_1050760 [Postia placenta MAD-698-R-SB12]|uniref:Uncharacterized protein n=1 Tax=Postia placenta MAD-698-R-SB12 TaxID=670580 RepID=A0A1X6MIH3_9APHY|nr:hypothetical protein POSPLADRAFT_1050760 [Postia placenta MAD-698-R-SB12]OSX56231.1 hypothetical protein POSPLADRAFT_1050760 [Postia placenta MAD-698-R-SB12]
MEGDLIVDPHDGAMDVGDTFYEDEKPEDIPLESYSESDRQHEDAYDNGIGRPKFPDPVTFSSGQADYIRLGKNLSTAIDRMSDKDVQPWGNENGFKPSFRMKCADSSAPLKYYFASKQLNIPSKVTKEGLVRKVDDCLREIISVSVLFSDPSMATHIIDICSGITQWG